MKLPQINGYNLPQFKNSFGGVTPRILIGQGLEERSKFDPATKRPAEPREVESKRAWLYYPDMGVQSLKLPADYTLPKDIEDLAEVELISPEACIINRQIYVRAKGLKSM